MLKRKIKPKVNTANNQIEIKRIHLLGTMYVRTFMVQQGKKYPWCLLAKREMT